MSNKLPNFVEFVSKKAFQSSVVLIMSAPQPVAGRQKIFPKLDVTRGAVIETVFVKYSNEANPAKNERKCCLNVVYDV